MALLAERELTFEKAVEIATATEMASKNLIDIGRKTPSAPSSDNNIDKVEEETKPPHFQPKRECYRCGGNHDPSSCKYKNEVCQKCQKEGRMAYVEERNLQSKTSVGAGRMANKERILLKKAPIKITSMPRIICLAIERNPAFKVAL